MSEFELRDYQERISSDAADKLVKHGMVYLAMQTRTGKTLTSFATVEKRGHKSALFITKKKAMKSIKDDFALMDVSYTLDVINFESVHKVDKEYDIYVVDEAHAVGAFPKPSKRYKIMGDLLAGSEVIFMSATPTPESYSQLYHQLTLSTYSGWIGYKNFYGWARDYVKVEQRMINGNLINDYSNADIDRIENETKHLFITLTQEQAGIKQEIEEFVLLCPMNPMIGNLMKHLKKHKVYEMKRGGTILCDTAVKMQNKFHQISSGTVKDEEGKYHVLDKSKAIFIRDKFKYKKKIAIYYKFKAEAIMLKEVFDNWTESPEDFQKSESSTFISQFVSGREGIRLDTADAIVFLNIDFSFLSYEQGKNRIVSKERKTQAPLYFVINQDGVDWRVYKTVTNKSDYTARHFRRDYEIPYNHFK